MLVTPRGADRRGGKKKVSKNIAAGVAHVNSSFNKHQDPEFSTAGQRGRLVVRRDAWASRARASRPPMPPRLAAADAGPQRPGTRCEKPSNRGAGPRVRPREGRPARPGLRRLIQSTLRSARPRHRAQRLPTAKRRPRLTRVQRPGGLAVPRAGLPLLPFT